MLPKPPAPAASAVSTAGSKADKAKKKAEEAAAAVPRTPVRVRKEDLLKALMRKLTPYHAIVAPNGQVHRRHRHRHRHQTPLTASRPCFLIISTRWLAA